MDLKEISLCYFFRLETGEMVVGKRAEILLKLQVTEGITKNAALIHCSYWNSAEYCSM